jgi:dimethylargininase
VSSPIAITREVSPSIAACELTHRAREPIDVNRARSQHVDYERALEHLGCAIRRLTAGADMPDSVFVEDIAVVLDEVAVVTCPGALSRRREVAAVAEALSRYRAVVQMEMPATMDGGDVLVVGRTIFVGRTSRTNGAGIERLRNAVQPFGYSVTPASVRECLHLKSAITALDDQTLLVNPRWASEEEFKRFELLDVDLSEPAAANVVRVGGDLLCAAAFPRTRERLERRGFRVTSVDVSELAKAEGAVTCCSLIFNDHLRHTP